MYGECRGIRKGESVVYKGSLPSSLPEQRGGERGERDTLRRGRGGKATTLRNAAENEEKGKRII